MEHRYITTEQLGVLSFRKAGRTLLRLYLQLYYRELGLELPKVLFLHEEHKFGWDPKKPSKRLLLVRNPYDLMVSWYFHWTLRKGRPITMDELIRHPEIGVPAFNRDHARWFAYEGDQKIVHFEHLVLRGTWGEMLEYFGMPVIPAAIDKIHGLCASVETIKRNLPWLTKKLRRSWRYMAIENGEVTISPTDPNAHKFRRGKIGGYVDYLTEAQILYIKENVWSPEAFEY